MSIAFDREAYELRRQARDAEAIAELKKRNRENFVAYCREISEIGDRFASRTLENYDPKTALQREAIKYCLLVVAELEKPAGYFHGPVGVGKTHLVGGIVNGLTAIGVPAIFSTGLTLLSRIRDTYNRSGKVKDGERDIISHYAKVPCLVLDDLGKEPFSTDTGRIFYTLVNQRYENNLPLIVTSNASLADLDDYWGRSGVEPHVGRALIDRIREMCGKFIRVDGSSYRGAE